MLCLSGNERSTPYPNNSVQRAPGNLLQRCLHVSLSCAYQSVDLGLQGMLLRPQLAQVLAGAGSPAGTRQAGAAAW